MCYVAFKSLMKNETTNNKKYVRFQKEMVNSLVVAGVYSTCQGQNKFQS